MCKQGHINAKKKKKKQTLTWFMYLVIDCKLIYFDFISILNKHLSA